MVITNLPVAHRKQFFFFFPALQTLTMPRRRSSLGVKMSLWRACFMAVMVDAVLKSIAAILHQDHRGHTTISTTLQV